MCSCTGEENVEHPHCRCVASKKNNMLIKPLLFLAYAPNQYLCYERNATFFRECFRDDNELSLNLVMFSTLKLLLTYFFLKTKMSIYNEAISKITAYVSNKYSIFCVINKGVQLLTLKAPITTAADDIYKYFFIVFQRK